MNNSHPSISVIVPIFNSKYYISETLKSIINQSVPPKEIIVLDDGSTDGGGEIAKSFPLVHYHFQANSGIAVARNQGVKLAKGNFLAFLDSDDLWTPDKLALQLSAFAANPNLDMVLGYVRQFYSPELEQKERQKIHIPKEVISGYSAGTMLIRQEAFLKVGFFEPHLKCGDFISWYLRAVDLELAMKMLPEVLMQRRIHQRNYGRSIDLDRSDYAKIVKASLDRRRAKGKTIAPKIN